jgi:putative endonuclease
MLRRIYSAYLAWRFGEIDPGATLGTRGEQAAARFLRMHGYTIIAHSVVDRGGEIDLIMTDRKRSLLAFVEVKTLASLKPGHPAERVDENKQARITRAALRYLHRKNMLECKCRFDVVAVWWPTGSAEPTKIEHYPSAFDASGTDSFYS